MSINFPTPTVLNQTFVDVGSGVTYIWNGTVSPVSGFWLAVSTPPSVGNGVSKTFKSGPIALPSVVGSSLAPIAHGLGDVPTVVRYYIKNKALTAQGGVAPGATVELYAQNHSGVGSTGRGFSAVIDSTNINITFGSDAQYLMFVDQVAPGTDFGIGTGANSSTNSNYINWDFYVEATAILPVQLDLSNGIIQRVTLQPQLYTSDSVLYTFPNTMDAPISKVYVNMVKQVNNAGAGNYVIGESIPILSMYNSNDAGNYGVSIWTDGNNVYIRPDNNGFQITNTDGTGGTVTADGRWAFSVMVESAAQSISVAAIYTKEYISPLLSVGVNTAGTVVPTPVNGTLLHGLGRVPKNVKCYLRCKSAIGGHAVGDIIEPETYSFTSATNYFYGIQFTWNATQIKYNAYKHGFVVMNMSTTAGDTQIFYNNTAMATYFDMFFTADA